MEESEESQPVCWIGWSLSQESVGLGGRQTEEPKLDVHFVGKGQNAKHSRANN